MRISDWSSDMCSSDLGGDARLARGADRVAGRIGFLHHRADETGEILDRAFQHRQAEVDMAEQAVERIVELRVRRQLAHRPRARGPALLRTPRPPPLRRALVNEDPFRHPPGGPDSLYARRGIPFSAHGLFRLAAHFSP